MKNTINILFPSVGVKPVGGYKIILQYANKLAEIGYEVNVIYSCYYDIPVNPIHKAIRFCKKSCEYIITILTKNFSCKNWVNLNPSIKENYVWSLFSSKIPKADYYFATAAVTAKALNRFEVPSKNKLYFIQSYEPWHIGESGLIETYQMNCQKTAVSKWLKDIVDKHSPCLYIPNGFDTTDYHLTVPIESKNPYTLSILYHEWIDKGFAIGFEALNLVKKDIPQLKVLAFGVFEKPSYLPDWINYYRNPDKDLHNKINNSASIYLGTSTMEGYGLTIGEAMMCGQAVVCTDNPGYREMAIPDVNALVCPIKDSRALADAIIKLMQDNDLRISLAKAGYESIQEYTIEKSFAKLQELL